MEIAVNGCRISCEVAGSGPPVVLVHGLGASRRIWTRLQGQLAESFTVLSYDLRGSGDTTEVGPGKDLSLAVWAEDLRGLRAELGIERPAIVGHSLGSSIALKHTLSSEPDDVSALVLMGADPELSRLAPRMEKVVALIAEVGMDAWVSEHWSKNTPFSDASLARSPEILDEYRAMVLANDAERYTRTCLAIASSESLVDQLSRLSQPALVISGSDDDRTLPSAGRELAASLPSAEFVELAGVGHTMPLEAPDEVGDAVRRFLASVDGA
jgi:3-oxoadipate enol-lactonase